MSLQDDKKDLRNTIRQRIQLLSEAERRKQSELLCAKLTAHPRFAAAKTVLLYASLPDEPDTTSLLRNYGQEKTILLPVVRGKDIILRKFSDFTHTEKGSFGISEPTGTDFTEIGAIDLVVVPGRAFTKQGYRMGRGGGYYDRLLSCSELKAYKIGYCFSQQIVPTLPTEPHDVCMDEVMYAE